MCRFIKSKLTVLMAVIVFMAATISLVLSAIHPQPTHAIAPAKVTIPSMKLP